MAPGARALVELADVGWLAQVGAQRAYDLAGFGDADAPHADRLLAGDDRMLALVGDRLGGGGGRTAEGE
jgi:hypothetical protein